jgi:hypothetical protein
MRRFKFPEKLSQYITSAGTVITRPDNGIIKVADDEFSYDQVAEMKKVGFVELFDQKKTKAQAAAAAAEKQEEKPVKV